MSGKRPPFSRVHGGWVRPPKNPPPYEPPPGVPGGTVTTTRGWEDFWIAVLIVCSILGWMVVDR